VSVAEQDGKPASLLNHYRKLAALRAGHPALAKGTQRVLESPARMLAVERVLDGERLVIIANLTGAAVDVPALAGEGPDLISGTRAPLRAWQTALYRPAR
jgi:alpha-glucosidase